jgi:hypothetical protein
VASGTIRITILMQNVVAVPAYARSGYFFPKQALGCAVVAMPAAYVGARTALSLDPDPFRRISAILLLGVLATLFVKPSSWTRERSAEHIRWGAMLPLVAALGFYGGFFQLGAGLPFLAIAVLAGGWDLVSANALKVGVVLGFTIVALITFAHSGRIDWGAGLALGVGNMIGAWAGAHAAVKKGPGWIRWIVAVMAVVAAAKLLTDAARP